MSNNFKVHPHEEVIREWLNGAKIQWLNNKGEWRDLYTDPSWLRAHQYRVKPVEKYVYTNTINHFAFIPCEPPDANLKLTYNENGMLIAAELLKLSN